MSKKPKNMLISEEHKVYIQWGHAKSERPRIILALALDVFTIATCLFNLNLDVISLLDTPPTTVVAESALALTYTVEGKSTIPSDGLAHHVSIATLPFDARTAHVIVPRARTMAYLQCTVKNTSEYRLLPGPVSVFLDDSFVSKTRISVSHPH